MTPRYRAGSCTLVVYILLNLLHSSHSATPVFTSPAATTSNETLDEDSTLNTVVLTLGATDTDNGNITFSIESQTPAGKFGINGVNLVTTDTFDYEDTGDRQYTLNIIAVTDSLTGSTATVTVTVDILNVNDNPPSFTSTIYYATVAENTVTDTSVVELVSDDDDGDTLTYQITGDDPAAKFKFDLTNVDLLITTSTPIDYDAMSVSNFKYSLTVEANDGLYTATATIIVSITGVDEAQPAWDVFSPVYTSATTPYNIAEDASIGTTIVTVQATDADEGVDGLVTYSFGTISTSSGIGSTTGLFHIDQVSGILTTTGTFDRDGGIEYYDVTIIATVASVSRVIRVGITEVNDNDPEFTQSVYKHNMLEDASAGDSLMTVIATDADFTHTLTYTLVTSTSKFTLDASTGQLDLQNVIDLDSVGEDSIYSLVVTVSDGSTTATSTIIVTVTPKNEHDPVLTDVTVNVNEDEIVGHVVTTIAATDGDSNSGSHADFTYSITSGNVDGKFSILASTGEILIAEALDYEDTTTTYTLTVHVADDDTSPRTATAVITISVNDISDETPVCTTTSLTAAIDENQAITYTFATVHCSDGDAVDSPTYTISDGNSDNKFSVNTNNGTLSLISGLDYDSGTKYYSLTIQYTDSTTTVEVSVIINVNPINEFTPTFGTDLNVTFSEDTPVGTSLATHTAADDDTAPHNIETYEITAVSNSGSALFSIDQSTGKITLGQSLDYETSTSYVVTVVATDGGNLKGTGSVTIQVSNENDVSPSCTSVYTKSVQEDIAVGTVIQDVICTDADGSTLTYTITSQTPSDDFEMDTTSISNLKTKSILDYETTNAYEIEITVSDGSQSATINIDISITDINEGGPSFTTTGYTVSVAEDASIGQSVITLTATDSDSPVGANHVSIYGVLTYEITSGNTGNKFIIESDTGKIMVAGVLNAETDSSYTLGVQVSDGTNVDTDSVTITVTGVNDNSPTCTSNMAFSKTMVEPGTVNDILYSFVCSDADGDPLTYTISNGDTTYFQILTGSTDLTLKAPIDYDTATTSEFDLVIDISDGTNTVTVSGSVIVTALNEHTPAFTATVYSVEKGEDTPPGSLITTVNANDDDKGETVTYSWVTSTTDFTLDQTSGEVILATVLDRETTPEYSLQLRALDGTNTVTATVTLTVTDVNDNTPTFNPDSYSASVSETLNSGAAVVTVAATDADDAATNSYGAVTYSIAGGNTGTRFLIDSSSGEITTAMTLDYEIAITYTLYIAATDSSGAPGARSSTAVVTVNVDPDNEFTPSFLSSPYSVNVNEDTAIGTSLLSVSATDQDDSDDGVVEYSLVTTSSFFYLDTSTGTISLKATLDYESSVTHTFNVVARDKGTSPNSATVQVTVNVNDTNDVTPSCTPALQTVTFSENLAQSSTVATLGCSDTDGTSPNNDLIYDIITVNGGGSSTTFNIDPTGVMTLSENFDFETTISYDVIIQVKDSGTSALSTTTTVRVEVTDYNEDTAVFTPASYSFSLPESTASGTSIYTVSAVDGDTTQNLTYSFNPTSTDFSIDASTGEIYLISDIDYDLLQSKVLYLTVEAVDDVSTPALLTATATVNVTITDVNDVTPSFVPAVYYATIVEDVSAVTVTTVTATDNDDTSLTYSLVNSFGIFQIPVSTDGIITLQSAADYETTTSFTLVVHAVDGSSNSASTTVHVTVTGANEATPVFSSTPSSVTVDENSALGTTVVDVNATDADDGNDGTLTYSILTEPAGFEDTLAIDPTTGIVTVAKVIDRDTMTTNPVSFVIHVTDAGTTALTATFDLTVTVGDVNDNTPQCSPQLYSTSISETMSGSSAVLSMTCIDDDKTSPNKDLTYTVVSGNAAGNFVVDSSTGDVTLQTSPVLDRETTNSYELIVRVSDNGTPSLSTTATLTITLDDENDNAPAFAQGVYTFTVDEDKTVGTSVGAVTATDNDISLAGSFDFLINSGNVDSKFAIDANTGDIKVIGALDYETITSYTLVIHAVDHVVPTFTGSATVTINIADVNDVTPVCSPALQTAEFREDTSTAVTIATVSCPDTDSVTVSYSIVSVDGVSTTTPFALDATTGVLTLTTTLNYEVDKLKTVVVHAIDAGGLTGTATINVVVTDYNEYDPVFTPTTFTASVSETASIGASVTLITATDDDTENNLTYSINPASSEFEVDPVTGIVYLSAALDFESVSSFSLTVVATDNGSPTTRSADTTLTITVLDTNDGVPVFNPAVYTVTVNENDGTGTIVTTVTATDVDSGTPTYSILSGNDDSVFRIDTSGDIVIDSITNFDYDSATKSYVIVVTASDVTNVGTATVAIAVSNYNDNAPSFGSTTSSTESIAEDTVSGYVIVTVTATDDDHSVDGDITYSITAGNTAGLFSINPSTGEVTLVGGLDIETTETYTVTITATDGGTNPSAKTATFILTVQVSDVNDVTPVCTKSLYSASVTENMAPLTSVMQLDCSDADKTATNNQINSYVIQTGNTNGDFRMTSTGEVQTVNMLDADSLDTYTLVIDVIDSGTTPLTTTATVIVTVTDTNDNIPDFGVSPKHATMSESESVGFSITTITASDDDSGAAGTVTYSIFSGNSDNTFDIDSATGDIKLIDTVDYETATDNPYVLVIYGTDNDGTTRLTGSTTLSLTVSDANDNSPSCNPALQSVQISELTARSTQITILTCSDSDASPNSDLSYSVVSINSDLTSTIFEVDGSGSVTTASSTDLNFESTTSYKILIRVSDGGSTSLSFTATVNVDITDENEFTPAYQSTPYSTNVAESTAVGTPVYVVSASDADASDNVTYSVNPANTYFDIDPLSGQISLIAPIDYDSLGTSKDVTLTVIASDGTNSVSETVTISVTNINDGLPVFDPGVYAVSIPENTSVSSTITTVTVNDIDDTSFTFSFASGNTDNCFTVDTNGNVILSDITKFDYDAQAKSYVLVVRAVDTGFNTATATVAVQVTSINEDPPVLNSTTNTVTLPEDSALGTSIVTVVATDNDDGADGELSYTVSTVTNNGDGKFTIDPTGGLVSLSGSLDMETHTSYQIEILVSDAGTTPGALTATYSLTVSISDVNDVAPACTQYVYVANISEGALFPDQVTTISCTDGDADSPNNDVNTFTITAGNTGSVFMALGNIVSVLGGLDRETTPSYTLLIDAIDDGTPALTTTVTLSITVTDVNDNNPSFATDPYIVTYDEDISMATTIETVTATDADTGDAALLVYSITSGDVNSKFTIDPNTGAILLTGQLDFETAASNPYNLVIHAVDSDPTTTRTGSTTVQVNIVDTNDNSPECSPVLYTYSLSENTATSSTNTLLTINCTDVDSGANAVLDYTITSVSSAAVSITNPFSIDTSGAIRLTSIVDYETYQALTVLVDVADTGASPNTVTVTVEVEVTNSNDNTPSFSSTTYSDNVIENTAIGSTVFTVTASDLDVSDTITYSIKIAVDEFDIDPSSGDILLTKALDYDTPPTSYEVVVIATDDGTPANSASATVTLAVTNFNDGTPEFDPGVYAVSLSENTAVGVTVATVTVTDIDDTASFSYNIDSGDTGNIFGISGTTTTAYITVDDDTNLDFESSTSYSLVISVSDPGGTTGTATVNVEVTNYNDDPPVFVSAASTVPVVEDASAGDTIIDLDATDADNGVDGVITYFITSVTSGGTGKFAVNPTTGLVTVSGSLDVETTPTYTVVIDAVDGGTDPGALTAQYTLTVTVTDVNDNTPYCSSSLYSASIAEDVATGTTVAQLTCLDADTDTPNNNVNSYPITSGNTGGEFLISNSGEVTTAVTFDREMTASYELTIVVSDSGTNPSVLSTTTTLTITITDVNDEDPVFIQAIYNIQIDEDTSLYTSIGEVNATDDDTGLAGAIGYSIVSGNGDSKFSLDRSTGVVRVAGSLDYETVTSYTLIVHAIDKEATFRTGSATLSLTILDVNDNSPICTSSLYTGSVAEDSGANTVVSMVVCTDSDSTSTYNTVTYSITPSSMQFSVGTSTGVVSVAATATLDTESTASYDITVQASDGTFTTDVTVAIAITNVNDKTPVFSPTGPYTVTVVENLAIGSTLYDVNATDADASDTTFIFSIISGNTDSRFTIGTTSGIIQTQKSIDRDGSYPTSYTLEITVVDGTSSGDLTATTSLVITVDDENDNYPECDASTYTITIPENQSPGTTLITPTCSDLDVAASPTLAYSFTAGNDDGKFQVNSGTGVVTLQAVLDYETVTSYTLKVAVDDQGTSNLVTYITMVIYVDPVNEFTPSFTGTPYDTIIDEDEATGFAVLTIAATDDDTGSTHGDVRYAFKSGNDAGMFSVNPSTGAVVVSGFLDRETTASYSLTVTASDMISGDADATTAENTFVITVRDVNDNYPEINPSSYAVTLNENVAVGSSVVLITATDDDEGVAGTTGLVYTITNGNTLNVFSMSGNQVTLGGNVDANTQSIYILTVEVADQGSPSRSSSTLITVQVVAINEHAPTFSSSTGSVTISESETLGSSIYQANAGDIDTGEFGVLRYYLRSGDSNNDFSVDLFTGDLRVANALDYDSLPNVYTLEIEVEDTATNMSGSTQTATTTITVTLTDVNDETPIFTLNTYSETLDEEGGAGDSVVTVMATDADTGTNSDITYSIVGGTGAARFSIDGTSGLITTVDNIDYEELQSYDLLVKAQDGGITPLSSTCIVRITINDLNDNTPVFQAADVAISISEDTPKSTTVATPQATDADSSSNNNNIITYSFQTSNTKFQIGPSSGAIEVMNNLDRETDASHTLVILAVDGGTSPSPKTGSATYTIVITDVNDENPQVSGSYDTTVLENEPINTIVYNISASDADENENAVLTYSLTSGNSDSDFRIDIASGLIQIQNELDRERTDEYFLEVTIVDSGTSPRSAVVTATVTVGDINDNPPIFQPDPTTSYSFNVSEEVPVGSNVDSVMAVDADTGTNGAVAYTVAYYILGSNDHFSLDTSSGLITTASVLDRENQATYIFVVRAYDGGDSVLTATVTVTISVTDFNDNIPFFSQSLYTATVVENSAVGTSILTLVIDDNDINANDDITLSISDSTTNLYIGANSSSFIIYVKSPIDREAISMFDFILLATDGGTPPLSFTTQIQITVGDENDNAPVFSPTFYNNEIAYNDGCQVTVATLTASDSDDGVSADITYTVTQNNNPHLFTLDSSTGVVTLIATAAADTGYKIYAAATDAGSPSQNSATGATVRVDTYDPETVILNYYLGISQSAYLGMETTFLTQLTTVYQVTYPTAQAKRWCVVTTNTTACVVRVYVVKDDTADDILELNNDKLFLTASQAYDISAKNDAGSPADEITGIGWTSFVIYRVEKYKAEVTTEPDTPWIQTATGIAVVTVVSVIAFIALIAVLVLVIYKVKHRNSGKPTNRVEVADDEGDNVARNRWQDKGHHTVNDMVKPYDKNKLPPAVVALPMPASTKKVPMQAQTKTLEKPKDINLLDDMKGGPTLVKRPEKLRAGSPIPTETVHHPPRKLPPVHTIDKPPPYRPPPAQRPARPGGSPQASIAGSANQTGPDFPEENTNFVVLNREFDGRAIDPASGRLYEYNTRTNERRWVQTPDGQQVKLRREDN